MKNYIRFSEIFNKYKVLCPLVLIVLWFTFLSADSLSGTEIMQRVSQRYIGDDEKTEIIMTLIKASGRQRIRKVAVWRKSYADGDKSLMKFLEPADVRGTGFLVWEHDNKDDDQWLYLPALKKVRRISVKEREQSFMGTDFSYEDLSSYRVDDYEHTLLDSQEYNNFDCYVIESIPLPDKNRSYGKTISWVRKDIYFVVRMDFYSRAGVLIKRLHVKDIKQIDGIWTAPEMEMADIKENHQTILEFKTIEYNTGISDNVFTERNLIAE